MGRTANYRAAVPPGLPAWVETRMNVFRQSPDTISQLARPLHDPLGMALFDGLDGEIADG